MSHQRWHIQCRSDLLATLMGDYWELHQCLQVTNNLAGEIEPFQQESELIPTQSQQGSEIIPKTDQQDLEQLQSRLMNYADQILEEVVSELLSDQATNIGGQNQQQSDASENYQIQLQQSDFMVETEQPIEVSGQVITPDSSHAPPLSIQVILRNPETKKVVVHILPQVLEPPFPATFHYVLNLPSNWSTSCLEGEVLLLATAEDRSRTLAQQSFQVIATQPAFPSLQNSASSEVPPPSASDPSQTQFQTRQSSDQALPPKLVSRPYQTQPKLPQIQKKNVSQSVAEKVTQADANSNNHPLSQWELIKEVVITKQQSDSD